MHHFSNVKERIKTAVSSVLDKGNYFFCFAEKIHEFSLRFFWVFGCELLVGCGFGVVWMRDVSGNEAYNQNVCREKACLFSTESYQRGLERTAFWQRRIATDSPTPMIEQKRLARLFGINFFSV